MTYLTPQKIAEITNGQYIGDESLLNVRVMGAVRDNRDVQQGNLFVCIRGERVDGHSFANSAFDSGASCCLAEIEIPDAKGPYVLVTSTLKAIKKLGGYYRSLFNIPVIGITGSVGKTTTKEMTAAVLGTKLNVLKTPENMNNELGVPLTLLSLDETYETAVIEMGVSEFGEMSRLAEMVRPDIFIMTKIGYSHLDNFGDLNGVLRAKSEAFKFMKSTGTAVLNGDDDLLRDYDPGIRKVTFGIHEHNDYRAENVCIENNNETLFDIVNCSVRYKLRVPSYGSHLVLCALAAAATGRLLGLSYEDIAQGLLSYAPVGGRANLTDTGFITLINDCYNSNPNSVEAALSSLSMLPQRHVAILGDMLGLGEQSSQLHVDVGSFAARCNIDCLICCGDMAESIFKGFKSAGGNEAAAYYFKTKAELISALPGLVQKGDSVLIKASHGMKFEELLPYLEGSFY